MQTEMPESGSRPQKHSAPDISWIHVAAMTSVNDENGIQTSKKWSDSKLLLETYPY